MIGFQGEAVQTNQTGGVLLINIVNSAGYFYMVHNVVGANRMSLFLADPGSYSASEILVLCSNTDDCSSPYASASIDLSQQYLQRSVLSYMGSFSGLGSLYGQMYIVIGSAAFTSPGTGECRGQISSTRTVVNPFQTYSSSSSTGHLAGAAHVAPATGVIALVATAVAAIVARFI